MTMVSSKTFENTVIMYDSKSKQIRNIVFKIETRIHPFIIPSFIHTDIKSGHCRTMIDGPMNLKLTNQSTSEANINGH
ncbi:hypothetical protein DERF_005708 [Dermatophagoides farinae]|uniref:Uncharacterized protein n=1 Tax=Dermatophagoides farinae TaxID=6954 RepID=A0A922I7I0_DERFA|nr:hypothetical protein DERF_005708 [Dermatophagoides farinae]